MLTVIQVELLNESGAALQEITDLYNLWKAWPGILAGLAGSFGELAKAHLFPSIFYGLMHGPGWNVYDGQKHE